MSDGEIGWSSFGQGSSDHNSKTGVQLEERGGNIHRCQKPVKLYLKFKKKRQTGDKIFDSHLGSGSAEIGAIGLDSISMQHEIDEDTLKAQEERFLRECFGR